jgi:hypothetical protein
VDYQLVVFPYDVDTAFLCWDVDNILNMSFISARTKCCTNNVDDSPPSDWAVWSG